MEGRLVAMGTLTACYRTSIQRLSAFDVSAGQSGPHLQNYSSITNSLPIRFGRKVLLPPSSVHLYGCTRSRRWEAGDIWRLPFVVRGTRNRKRNGIALLVTEDDHRCANAPPDVSPNKKPNRSRLSPSRLCRAAQRWCQEVAPSAGGKS